LIINHADDSAFERIINTPTRGIGDRTLMMIREHAKISGLSLWHELEQLLAQQSFAARAHSALLAFITLIKTMTENTLSMKLHQQVEYVLSTSGLIEHYRKE